MSALSVNTPFPTFLDIDGQPLDAGYIYLGVANQATEANPIQAYWDAALSVPATQPILTKAGFPVNAGVPARVYVNSDYSIVVKNRNGFQVFSSPTSTDRYNDAVVNIDSSDITFLQAGTGAVARTAQAKMRDVVSVLDFGAVGDGVTDDTAAIQAGIDATKNGFILYFPAGTYLCNSGLTLGRGSKLVGQNTAMPDYRSLNQNVSKITFPSTTTNFVAIDIDLADAESTYVWGVSIENLFIEGVQTTGSIGINANRLANARFRNVGIERFARGLNVIYGMTNTYDSVSSQLCTEAALYIDNSFGVTTTQRFVDCSFRQSPWGCIVAVSNGQYILDTVFDHCTVESTTTGGVNVYKGCSVTFIEPYFENVTDAATSLSGTAIRLYEDGTSSRTDTLSICNIIGGDISGPNTGSGFANALVYVGSGAAAVNIIGGLYQRALHGVQVNAACKDRVVNAERPSFVSVTNLYTGTDVQRVGVWPIAVLGASAVTLRNFSGRFGSALRTDANTLEIRNSGDSSYYTEHSAADTALQEVNTIGAGGASVSYRIRVQNAGTLQEAARFRSNGYTKFTSTGAFAVPNYVGSSADALHQFLSDSAAQTLVVSNLSTSASANCIRTTKPDVTNGFHYLASRTDTGTNVFQVAANGNVTNTGNSYGAISDIKLKTDITDSASQWDDIKALTVRKYRLKDDPDGFRQIGLIAQEVELVSPGLVEETPDMVPVEVGAFDDEGNAVNTIEYQDAGTVTKSIKYSVVNLKMLKALQEAMARIEELEAKIK